MTTGLRAVSGPLWRSNPAAAPRWNRPRRFSGERPKATVEWADLIGRVAAHGDRDAFKLLFEHFAPRVKGFLVKTGMNADAAEEIAQNTLLTVWRKAAQFDPASAGAAAWIFTIARNLRIDSARQAARRARAAVSAERDGTPEVADSPETIMSRRDDVSRVEAALLRLSEEQSTVIRMSFIEERPHGEIAERLGLPLGTVKSRIRLAVGRLRDFLDD
nr:sigma-70 family RNA polymerase sigma factor [Bradyrhizobium manausense]